MLDLWIIINTCTAFHIKKGFILLRNAVNLGFCNRKGRQNDKNANNYLHNIAFCYVFLRKTRCKGLPEDILYDVYVIYGVVLRRSCYL